MPSIMQWPMHHNEYPSHRPISRSICDQGRRSQNIRTQQTSVKDMSNHFHDFSFRVCTLASSSESCIPVAKISSLSSSDGFPPGPNNLLVGSVFWMLLIGRVGSLESDGWGVSR